MYFQKFEMVLSLKGAICKTPMKKDLLMQQMMLAALVNQKFCFKIFTSDLNIYLSYHNIGLMADRHKVNSFFGHVGIEHASVEFRILNAWFYNYTIKKFLHRKSLIRFI